MSHVERRDRRKKVTVTRESFRVDTYYDVDRVNTEKVQWRLDCGETIYLIPMAGVAEVKIEYMQ